MPTSSDSKAGAATPEVSSTPPILNRARSRRSLPLTNSRSPASNRTCGPGPQITSPSCSTATTVSPISRPIHSTPAPPARSVEFSGTRMTISG